MRVRLAAPKTRLGKSGPQAKYSIKLITGMPANMEGNPVLTLGYLKDNKLSFSLRPLFSVRLFWRGQSRFRCYASVYENSTGEK